MVLCRATSPFDPEFPRKIQLVTLDISQYSCGVPLNQLTMTNKSTITGWAKPINHSDLRAINHSDWILFPG